MKRDYTVQEGARLRAFYESIAPYCQFLLFDRGWKHPVFGQKRADLFVEWEVALKAALEGRGNPGIISNMFGDSANDFHILAWVDSDSPEANADAELMMEGTEGPKVETGGGGLHFPVWLPPTLVSLGLTSNNPIADNIQLLMGPHIRILPGSWQSYEGANAKGRKRSDVERHYTLVRGGDIPVAPAALERRIMEYKASRKTAKGHRVAGDRKDAQVNLDGELPPEAVAAAKARGEGGYEGKRHDTIFKFALRLRAMGIKEDQVRERMLEAIMVIAPEFAASDPSRYRHSLRAIEDAIRIGGYIMEDNLQDFEVDIVPRFDTLLLDYRHRLAALGYELRWNEMRSQDEYRQLDEHGEWGPWEDMDNKTQRDLEVFFHDRVVTPPCFEGDAPQIKIYGLKHRTVDQRKVMSVLSSLSSANSVDLFREDLDALPEWDGEPRLERWLERHFYVYPKYRRMARFAFLRQMVGLVMMQYEPGSKFDYLMVLMGEQGIGKSTFVETLALREEYHSDQLNLRESKKERLENLAGAAIVECPEFEGVDSGRVESILNYASMKVEKSRMAYDRKSTTFKRRHVAFATTNNEFALPVSFNGGRRFWMVKLGAFRCRRSDGTVKHLTDNQTVSYMAASLERELPQLLAEAKAEWRRMVKAGEDPAKMPSDMKEYQMQLVVDHSHQSHTSVAAMVQDFLINGWRVTVERDDGGKEEEVRYEPGDPFDFLQLCRFVDPKNPHMHDKRISELLSSRWSCSSSRVWRWDESQGRKRQITEWEPGEPVLEVIEEGEAINDETLKRGWTDAPTDMDLPDEPADLREVLGELYDEDEELRASVSEGKRRRRTREAALRWLSGLLPVWPGKLREFYPEAQADRSLHRLWPTSELAALFNHHNPGEFPIDRSGMAEALRVFGCLGREMVKGASLERYWLLCPSQANLPEGTKKDAADWSRSERAWYQDLMVSPANREEEFDACTGDPVELVWPQAEDAA